MIDGWMGGEHRLGQPGERRKIRQEKSGKQQGGTLPDASKLKDMLSGRKTATRNSHDGYPPTVRGFFQTGNVAAGQLVQVCDTHTLERSNM